jgi:hypothetical protein
MMSKSLGEFVEEKKTKTPKEVLGKVAELIERSGIDIDEIGRLDKVIIGDYQAISKDDAGETHVHDLQKAHIVLTPKWETGPEWPVVQQAAPVVIKPPKAPTKKAASLIHKWNTAIALPDPQIGFRRLSDGTLDPFHDEKAMNVALQLVAAHQNDGGVHKLVNLGDFLDLQQQSKYIQEAAFALTTQPAIDRGHSFLAEQRAVAPDAELVVLEGNHDRRMQNFVTLNAQAAFGLKRANVPESWPVMSIPYLLRCDELGVLYIDAWPAGEYWINDKLRCIHGNKVRSGGSTANAQVKDNPHISTIFGHVHRIEAHYKTVHDRSGPIRSLALTPGCLCRVDGVVPSVNGSTGISGDPATHWEDWQQGIAVIRYTDDTFFASTHQIMDGVAVVGGQEFVAA